MLGTVSKLVGSIAGTGVAILLVWLASKGLGTCTAASDGTTCTILGFSYAQIMAAVGGLLSAIFVYFFPANQPPS